MEALCEKRSPRSGKLLFGSSPWLLAGFSIIAGLVVLVLSLHGSNRGEQAVIRNVVDRAEALIWALEAGTRTWMGVQGEATVLQSLVEETAKLPGIRFLAVTDNRGRILAHSDPDRVGESFAIDLPAGWEDAKDSQWRVRAAGDAPVFEVHRLFAPVREDPLAFSNYRMGRHGRHGMMRRMREMPAAAPEVTKSYVFLGFDHKPFEEAAAEDRQRNLLAAGITGALGLAGFISVFWAHHHRRSRRMLLDARALSAEVLISLPAGLLTRDPDGNIGMINAAAAGMLGVHPDAVRGRPLSGVPGLDWDGMVAEMNRGGKILDREAELAPSPEQRVPVGVEASPIRSEDGVFLGHLFIFRNMDEVKRLRAEVERGRRLTALGNLAAGVAHEIRNPLSSIKGLAVFLAEKARPGPEKEAAKTMVGEVERLNRVVSELLDFARPAAFKLAPADMNDVIARALRLADADFTAGEITADFVPDASLPPVFINAERFAQALLNLFLNAVQAMEPGGVLRVVPALKAGGGALSVTVSDNGGGMTEEVRASLFTPYFTTKPSGTGLGLAIVHQIVEGHGGRVDVASAVGAGSVFTLTVPLLPEPPGGRE